MKKITGIVLSLSLILSNCVRDEKIDDFPLEKPKIVVNCFFKNDQPMEFFVSKSLSSIDNAKIKKLSNAEIKIYENETLVEVINQESGNPDNTTDAYYISNFKPHLGKRYKISVSAPNLASISAEAELAPEMINPTAKIIKMDTLISLTHPDYTWFTKDSLKYMIILRNGSILLNIPDKPNEKNYYKINLYAEQKYFNGTNWDYRFQPVYIWNTESENSSYYQNGLFLSDNLNDGKTIPVNIDIRYDNIYSAETKVKFKIIISSQSEEKHKYDISLGQFFQNKDNPFVEPALVYTNITGGYGIFASESDSEIILEK